MDLWIVNVKFSVKELRKSCGAVLTLSGTIISLCHRSDAVDMHGLLIISRNGYTAVLFLRTSEMSLITTVWLITF